MREMEKKRKRLTFFVVLFPCVVDLADWRS